MLVRLYWTRNVSFHLFDSSAMYRQEAKVGQSFLLLFVGREMCPHPCEEERWDPAASSSRVHGNDGAIGKGCTHDDVTETTLPRCAPRWRVAPA